MSVLSVRFLGCVKNICRVTSSIKINLRKNSSKQVQSSTLPSETNDQIAPNYLAFHKKFDVMLKSSLSKDMVVISDFLSADEEYSILKEIEPYLKRLRYEFDHWDDAIHGYRETERLKWNEENSKIIQRVRELSFPPGSSQLKHVHVLDLDAKGLIKPHIDSSRFCGSTIAGLSLLSDCVMRLIHHQRTDQVADVLLKQRSLYIMRDSARYDYTHEVLGAEHSSFMGLKVPRDRRISVICRNEPTPSGGNPHP